MLQYNLQLDRFSCELGNNSVEIGGPLPEIISKKKFR